MKGNNINREDLQVDVGMLEDYALQNNLTIDLNDTQAYPPKEFYRHGVRVTHIPTGFTVYVNRSNVQAINMYTATNKIVQYIKQAGD